MSEPADHLIGPIGHEGLPAHESNLTVQPGVSQPPAINPRLRARKRRPQAADELAKGLLGGDRSALSQSITLIESSRPEDREQARQVIDRVLPQTGRSIRIGITGVPGVGKSSFIERFGMTLIEQHGKRVAVLAIDPTSELSKGSILGDKSRMPRLAAHDAAFVRPSPSAGSLGGVAAKTRESILLCEAFGFDVVLVETVGVGQSEAAVHSMVDCFLLLLLAGAGDELQGIKRGIMELVDLVAIHKADGDNRLRCEVAQGQTRSALQLFPAKVAGWKPPVLLVSSLTGDGHVGLWAEMARFHQTMSASGEFGRRRAHQDVDWMRDAVHQELASALDRDSQVNEARLRLEADVASGKIAPHRAAETLLDEIWRAIKRLEGKPS